MTVSYSEYNKAKNEFLYKHEKTAECKIYTSGMENNRWHKEYCFEDGANWFEIMDIIEELAEVEVYGVKFNVTVKLHRTEFWSTDDSKSKYTYERA